MSLNDGAKKTTAITQLSSYLFISFLHYYLLLLLLNTSLIANAILQTQRGLIPSKSQIPCVHGQFINNRCICPPGWTGPFCEHCFGRVRYNSTVHSFSDGKRNYTASSRCTWIIEDEVNTTTSVPLLLNISNFMTECCWDHFYVYDGDSVNNNLIAVLSGRQSSRQITVPSGKAIVYFVSDLAYNLEGFIVNYNWDKCQKNCSGNGICKDGFCKCNDGYIGNACELPICTSTIDQNNSPCEHGACNGNEICNCSIGYHGDFCQTDIWQSVWDTVHTKNTEHFTPRASHAMAVDKNIAYIYGGYYFKEKENQDLLMYNFDTKTFTHINSLKPPPSRYDHSMVLYEDALYVFGGVINDLTITNEFLKYNITAKTWEVLRPHEDDPESSPRAVAGHTAHVFGRQMFVFFGYNPFEGFYHHVQIYSFDTREWKMGKQNDIVGRFGHSSALSTNTKETMIYIYGGYNQASQEAAYNISDELLMYNPETEEWENLGSDGTRLFRHSAAIVDQQLIITGGNSHNESTSVRDSECFSSKVVAYDIACVQWIRNDNTINPNSKYANVNRYGHTSATYNGAVYVFGGFNGMMLNDVIKLTLDDCNLSATTVEGCEGKKDGYRCKLINRNCTRVDHSVSYRQNFLSLIKSESPRNSVFNCPGISNRGLQCSGFKECQACFDQRNCGWCESTSQCVNSDTGCPDGSAITSDEHSCPTKSKAILFPEKKRPCNMATNCYACKRMDHCSWFTIETRPSCISQEDEAVLVEQHNRIQSERLASLAHSMQPSSRTIADFRYLQTSNASNAICPLPCSSFTHCQNCTQSNCMWCPSTKRCVSMDTYMISFPYGQCESWITQANSHNNRACELDPNDCSLQKTCDECQQIGPRCGWCDDGNGTGLGKCLAGSLKSPTLPNMCDDKHWYFTGQPECQCNGHSNCSSISLINQLGTDSKSCNRCQDDTSGEHCERCADGYFGDPRNGGNCTKCQCHDQAQSCDNEKGYCFCTTKGVIGDHCDTCDTKYEGDPKINKPCSYKLAIDFIFTFKLDNNEDKDKYVNQINFFAVPFKHDTDVQFSISCDGLVDAHVDVAVTSAYDDGDRPNKILSNYTCNAHGFKKTWSPTDSRFHLYPFGADSNTTFHVKVYNFSTPIKIQISFAQSPPINWILFFVIFAACFVVLLVIAGLVWVIKQRVERYHQIQATHVEIERMASRPFASVQLDLSSKQYDSATPISIEPCSNYQSGIYTLIVRLPTGGQNYTPHSTSGLAVASSLCSLTQSQLALLQPPDSDNQQAGQKSSLRRFISFKNPFASNT